MTERETQSAATIRQCPDPSKCYGVGCHGCDEPVISKMAPGYADAADVREAAWGR